MRSSPLICRSKPDAHAWASRDPQSTCPLCGSAGDVQQAGWWSVFVRIRPDLNAWFLPSAR